MRVTIVGQEESPVVIQGLRATVHQRRSPLPGTVVGYNSLGDGPVPETIYVDLDAHPPSYAYVDADTNEHRSFTFEVRKSQLLLLNLVALTKACDCEWTAEVLYTFQGKARTATIAERKKPFRTSAVSNAQHCYWNGDTSVCTPPAPPGEGERRANPRCCSA